MKKDPPKRRGRPGYDGELGEAFNGYTVNDGVVSLNLGAGSITRISATDFPAVSRYKWSARSNGHGHVYARAFVSDWPTASRRPFLHQFLLRPAPGLVVDHIDGDTLNNTRPNLRPLTKRQNAENNPAFRDQQQPPGPAPDPAGRTADFPEGAPDRGSVHGIPEPLYRIFKFACGVEEWAQRHWRGYPDKVKEVLDSFAIRPASDTYGPVPCRPVRAVRLAVNGWNDGTVRRYTIRCWISVALRVWLERLFRHMVGRSAGAALTYFDFCGADGFGLSFWRGFQPTPREIAGAMNDAWSIGPGNVWKFGTCYKGYPGFTLK